MTLDRRLAMSWERVREPVLFGLGLVWALWVDIPNLLHRAAAIPTPSGGT